MTAASTIELKIDEKAISYAKIYATLLTEQFQRKRAFASIVGLFALINFLEKTNLDIQKSMTLFRNPLINEQYEITDVYINNYHIEIRIVTEGNAFLIPKSHYENNIAPDFYAVIKMDNSLKFAELLGFAPSQDLSKEAFDYYYYSCSFKNLISYEEFLNHIKKPKKYNFSKEDHELFKNNYLSLMDNEIDKQTKQIILKHLFECSECRTEFCCFTGFEMVSCNMNRYPELFDDQTLKVIGAQVVNDEKYKDKEQTIYIGDDEQIVEELDTQAQNVSIDNNLNNNITELKNEQEENNNSNQTENTGSDITPSIDLAKDVPAEEPKEQLIPETKQEVSMPTTTLETSKLEETVSDILDELFNTDEDTIETPKEEKLPDNNIGVIKEENQIIEENKIEPIPDIIDSTEEIKDTPVIEPIPDIIDSTEEIKDTPVIEPIPDIIDSTEEIKDTPVIEPIPDIIDSTEEIKDVPEIEPIPDIIDSTEEIKDISEQIIEENEPDIINETKDISLIDNTDDDLIEIIPNDDNEESDIIKEDENSNPENIEKVIVDYDETGEPIYSYITNIDSSEFDGIEDLPEIDSSSSEIQNISEDYNENSESQILGNKEITDSNTKDNIADINEPQVNKEEKQTEIEDTSDETTKNNEEYSDNKITADIDNLEEKTPVNIAANILESEYIKDNEPNTDSITNEEENSEFNNTDTNDQESTEDQEESEETSQSEESEEFEEYDESDNDFDGDGEDEYKYAKKPSAKMGMLIGLILLLLLVAGGSIFYFISNKNTNKPIIISNNQQNNIDQQSPDGQSQEMNNQPDQQNQEGLEISDQSDQQNQVQSEDMFGDGIEIADNNQGNNQPEEQPTPPPVQENNMQIPPTSNNQQNNTPTDVSNIMTQAFTSGNNAVILRNVNWMCAPALFTNNTFKSYLQRLDSTLKINIKNNLLNATETPQNNSITVKLAIDNDGNLIKSLISESSGSNQIDNFVLQSINETLQTEKTLIFNDGEQKSDKYFLQVVIKF